MIWTTVLNPAIDILYPVEELTSKTTFTDIPTSMYPAGKGLNFAKVVRVLGEDVTVIALMPEADKDRFAHYLSAHNIPYEFISIPGSARINTTIFDTHSHFVQHFNSRGALCTPQIQALLERKFAQLLQKATDTDYWVLSGSIPRGMTHEIYGTLIDQCNRYQIPVALDTRDEPLAYGVAQVPTLLTPNSDELAALLDTPLVGLTALIEKGREILNSGIETLFITLGEDGVIGFRGSRIYRCKSESVEVVDTVGCGDAFLAGVVVAQVRHFSFEETCRLGVACGTANALQKGPGEVKREDINNLMEQVLIEEVVVK